MKAWRAHRLGEPDDVLTLDDVPEPEPGPHDVVVEVAAASLNFPDVLMCRGDYQVKPPVPFTPGAEVAGTVVARGAEVDEPEIGARVIAVPHFGAGGFAQRTIAPAAMTYPIPDSLDWSAAGALHITYQTGYVALHRRAALRPGEVLLVHAGAGGVGSAAIQLGRAAGARVFATAGGPEKTAICEELGAELAIDYRATDFVERVKEATDGRGADVIYDPVGGDVFDRSRRCIAWEGRILVIGFTGGRFADAPTNHLLIKNYAVVGVHWGMYNVFEPRLARETHDALMALHAQGRIAPFVSLEIGIAEIPAALARLGARGTYGKVVARF